MNQPKKILIAYDGSSCAEAALNDLRQAGLPDEVEARVFSVAEQWLPPLRSYALVDVHMPEEAPGLVETANTLAREAANVVRTLFPHWQVTEEVFIGSPARILLEQADAWQPDLVIVGSHGRSALGRFVLGSVSHKIATEARGSVRIARGRLNEPGLPLRLIIGLDGSPGADIAVTAVAQRHWPAGTEVLIVTADFAMPPTVAGHPPGPLVQWMLDERERIRAAVAGAVETLQAAGLSVSSLLKDERPGKLLCEEAERWGADCIFVGATQMGRVDRFLLGSVSASVAARAHCSVEIVRAPADVA